MSIANALLKFQKDALQCDQLIADAHKGDEFGNFHLTDLDRDQVIVASFLNLFIAWESFLEECLAQYMIGAKTTTGKRPTRFVRPKTLDSARKLAVGVNRFFDYANHEHIKKIANLYFENGYPFEPIISSSFSDLSDLRIMRNASAHISSTTQTTLESLAQRVFSIPQPGIELPSMLMMTRPGFAPGTTLLSEYRGKLLVMADLISKG